METETWPRWLPAPHLRDDELHFTLHRGDKNGACGQLVMWVAAGHPTTHRRRCVYCAGVAKVNGYAL